MAAVEYDLVKSVEKTYTAVVEPHSTCTSTCTL